MSVWDWLEQPEAQSDPHYWAATFGGHCWIILGLWGVLAACLGIWIAAWLAPALYLILWEGTQITLAVRDGRLTHGLVWDAILDSVAVAFGCYAASCLASGEYIASGLTWGASVIVAGIGVRRRYARLP